MSLFGEPLPFEDETAASLIRRSGFPPEGTYDQMPEVYLCPCCSEFSKQQERERLLREARDAKEAERRRILQLDVFEERARPLPSGDSRRKAYRRIVEDEEPMEPLPNVPPPPPTLDELRRAKRDQNVPKLVVTVHHGRNISAEAEDPISVIVRCGAFEGQTAKVPRGQEVLTPWEELFEFPYMNSNEPLEVLVVNDALPEANDQLVGGVVIPSDALHDRERGDQETLPVMPEEQMQDGYGTCKDGPLGSIIASWYVRDGDEKMDETAMEQQTLANPLGCTFVAHRVFQYTDHGAEPYPGGVLCVLRDTDDNCSESVLYTPGSAAEPSLSPYQTKEGYHYLPENPSQIMQLNTEKKLGHILVCVPKQEEAEGDEEEELLVIGAVPLDFERLYNKGSAVLLIESKSKDDALWGEIEIEWANAPLDEEKPHPALLEVQKESLFVTVVRGLNLVRPNGEAVDNGFVTVATGELEGATVEAPAVEDDEGNRVINWNQEVRFIEVDPAQHEIEVQAFEKDRLISVGTCDLGSDDEGVVIIQMHQADDPSERAGEIVVSYKRLHAPKSAEEEQQELARAAEIARQEKAARDEEDEEDEEREEAARHGGYGESDADRHHDGEEDEEVEEQEEEEEEEEPQRAGVEPVQEYPMGIQHEADDAEEREAGDEMAEEEQEEEEEEAHHAEEMEEAEEPQEEEEEEERHEEEEEEEAREEEEEEAHEEEEEQEEAHEEEEEQEEAHEEEEQEEAHEEEEQEEAHEEEEQEELAAEEEEEEDQHHEEEEEQQQEVEEEQEEEARDSHAGEEEEQQEEEEEEQHHGEEGEEEEAQEEQQEEDAQEEEEDADRDLHDHEEGEEEAQEDEEDGADHHDGEEDQQDDQQEDDNAAHADDDAAHHGADEEDDGDRHAGDDEEGAEGEPRGEHYEEEPEEAGAHEAAEEAEQEPQPDYSVPVQNQPRRPINWKAKGRYANAGYQQPWYPSGNPKSEQHLPFSKTNLSKKNRESIRELETRKSRIEEESVRRGSTPRRSSTRGLSSGSQ